MSKPFPCCCACTPCPDYDFPWVFRFCNLTEDNTGRWTPQAPTGTTEPLISTWLNGLSSQTFSLTPAGTSGNERIYSSGIITVPSPFTPMRYFDARRAVPTAVRVITALRLSIEVSDLCGKVRTLNILLSGIDATDTSPVLLARFTDPSTAFPTSPNCGALYTRNVRNDPFVEPIFSSGTLIFKMNDGISLLCPAPPPPTAATVNISSVGSSLVS